MNKNRLTLKNKSSLIVGAMIILATLVHSQNLFSQDQDTLAEPPAGYDSYNSAIPHSTTQIVSYYSSTVGKNRNTRILLPPGYTEDSTYNVLYLLHGIGGDINEWYYNGVPHNILDNLYALGRIDPMIVVLPNGRAMEDDSPGSNIYAADKVQGFADFEFELITDLIPFIDTSYSVKPGREARAIAGLSMGGGQALDFGLAHLDTFAWVGAFSPAPNTNPADELIPNFDEDTSKISALWLSGGDADGLFYICKGTHDYMAQHGVEHYFNVEPGKGHDWSVWKPSLYHFVQRIFGVEPLYDTALYHKPPKVDNKPSAIKNSDISNDRFFYNPSDQSIVFRGEGDIKNLNIYDINGVLKFSETNFDRNSVDISQYPKGVYVVVLSDGNSLFHRKIIKY